MMPDLIRHSQELLCRVRRLHRLVNSEKFAELYEKCSRAAAEEVAAHIQSGDLAAVLGWVDRQLMIDLYDLPVKQLRHIASGYAIPEYHILRKHELVEAILNERENPESTCKHDSDGDEGESPTHDVGEATKGSRQDVGIDLELCARLFLGDASE